jgi:hypothetical protein
MKHKVAELEGALLDTAVALAEGLTPRDYEHGSCWYCPEPGRGLVPFQPSIDWATGGQIIERERIALVPPSRADRPDADWFAETPEQVDEPLGECGKTPLIAAMRAYVASKFGVEVDLPC